MQRIQNRLPKAKMPSFHGSRFSHEPLPYYYAFGNTPAQNLLEYVPSDVGEPSVLLLASGDIRSCLLTIWKNFDPAFKHRFHGVDFVVNDRSAAVIARNIIFLYLCLNTPGNKSQKKEWILAMWSIWYCHELLPAHVIILQSALEALLCIFSDKGRPCSSSDHPLLSLVQYNSPDTLETIKTVWKMWYNREINVTSVKNMRSARKKMCDSKIGPLGQINLDFKATLGTLDVCGILGMSISSNFECLKKDYHSYLESGNAFGESLFGNGPTTQQTSINLTLFERKDGEYTLHYGSCPFRCFPQTYIQSISGMISSGMHVPASVKNGPCVDSKALEQAPLLANSFQQFSMWVSSTARVLQNRHANVSFTFDVSDVFKFSQSWIESRKKQFDLIYATNVIDSVSPPTFVLAAVQLLTDTGSFLSSTMRFRQLCSNITEYIQTVFGIKSEMLPLICGIRCVNHEGLAYSSPVSPSHIPSDFSDKDASMSDMQEKLLIWKKVSGNPLIIDSLASHPHISEQLAASFLASCSIINQHNSCADTTFEVLKAFTTRLSETDLVQSHEFWEGLCSRLQRIDHLKSFLTSIQTQAFVKGYHFHLVVDEHTCPTCNDVPLSEYLGLFCVEVQSLSKCNDFLVCLDHHLPTLSQILCKENNLNVTLQCIDSLSGVPVVHGLKLYLFAPLSFVKDRYYLTLLQYESKCPLPIFHRYPSEECLVDSSSFSLPKHWPPSESSGCKYSSSLGTLTDHCGSKDGFVSKLSLVKDDLPALLKGEIQIEQISSTELVIQCLNCSIQIRYPYPISNSTLIIQRSRKLGTLTVKAKREPHRYEEEGQSFHVNPEDHFSLVPYSCGPSNLEAILLTQYTRNERVAILNTDPGALTSPLLKVKRIFVLLLILETDKFFQLVLPEFNVVGLVKIINRVIDVHRRTHAIDLFFCFKDTLNQTTSRYIDEQLAQGSYAAPFHLKSLFLYKEAYDLLKKIFNSFASHTLQPAAKYPLSSNPPDLSRCKIESHFTRAVVYPLYPESVISGQELQDTVRCQCCQQLVDPENVQNCVKCKTQSYCSQECRIEGWSEHQLHCKGDEPLKPNTSEICNYCNGQAGIQGLKKCLGCKSVSYCSKQCQTDHWKIEHNILCTKSFSSPSSESYLIPGPPTDKGCISKLISSEKSDTQPPIRQEKYQKDVVVEDVIKQVDQPKQPTDCEVLGNEQCSYCHQQSTHLKHCLRCYKALYCGKECQHAHWNKHKRECFISDASVPVSEVCSYCKNEAGPEGLKNCLGCKSVFYCSKQCQIDHWKIEHNILCTKSLSPSSGPSLVPGPPADKKCSSKLISSAKSNTQPSSRREKDQVSQDMIKQVDQTKQPTDSEICSYCHQQSPHLKHCSRCYKVLYCGGECQHAHWSKHKRECFISDASVPTSEVCSHCKSEAGPEGLKNCLGCKSVSYCSKQCQIDHWKVEHNIICTKSLSPNSGPSVVLGPPTDKKCSSKLMSEKKDTQPSSRREIYQISEDVIKQVDQPKQPTDYEILGIEQCSYCHQQSPHLKHCSRCYKVLYCGGECQHAHWSKHRRQCKKVKECPSKLD